MKLKQLVVLFVCIFVPLLLISAYVLLLGMAGAFDQPKPSNPDELHTQVIVGSKDGCKFDLIWTSSSAGVHVRAWYKGYIDLKDPETRVHRQLGKSVYSKRGWRKEHGKR